MLDAALDGRLSAEELCFFKKHLAECENCRADYEMHKIMLDALHAPVPEPHKHIHDAVMAKLPRVAKRTKWLRFARAAGGTAVAAVICLVILRAPMLGEMTNDKAECEPNTPEAMDGLWEATGENSTLGNSSQYSSKAECNTSHMVDLPSLGNTAIPETPDEDADSLANTSDSTVFRYENILVLLKGDKATLFFQNENGEHTAMLNSKRIGEKTLILYGESGEAQFEIDENNLILIKSTIPEIGLKG